MKLLAFDTLIFREGDTYVAYSPRLEVTSCGRTADEAKEYLRTAVRLFLEEADKMGTLEEILTDAGYIKGSAGEWQPPEMLCTEKLVVGWA